MKALAEKSELPEAAIHKTKITWEECDLFAYQLTCLNFVIYFFKVQFYHNSCDLVRMLEMDVEKIFFFFLQNSQHIEATIFIPLINISTSDL
jgi:hypothetical protein